MKFQAVITGWYECSDTHLQETYGTTDPLECCRIDETGSVEELIQYMEDLCITVTPQDLPLVSKP